MMKASQDSVFDDYHRMMDLDLHQTRLLVCQGMSGSGKTTALEHLCKHHRAFCDRSPHTFRLADTRCPLPALQNQLVLLDDIRFVGQLLSLGRLLSSGNTVLVASHLAPLYFIPWRSFWPSRVFVMDRNTGKIERYLERKRVTFSRQ
ncbi:MAG: hypothetical protein ABGZ17_07430, partial [Planctomycetaceae bacterium]